MVAALKVALSIPRLHSGQFSFEDRLEEVARSTGWFEET
jgi:hypothetical protein